MIIYSRVNSKFQPKYLKPHQIVNFKVKALKIISLSFSTSLTENCIKIWKTQTQKWQKVLGQVQIVLSVLDWTKQKNQLNLENDRKLSVSSSLASWKRDMWHS